MSNSKIKLNPIAVERSKFESRIAGLEAWKSSYEKQEEDERKFNISMMLSLNGIAAALVTKGMVTMAELELGRQTALKEYCEQLQAIEAAKKQTATQQPAVLDGCENCQVIAEINVGDSIIPEDAELERRRLEIQDEEAQSNTGEG